MDEVINRTPPGDPLQHGFDEGPWRAAHALELGHHMGMPPAHRPRTRVRLLYDDEALYVQFVVEDRYVRAVATATHGPVWQDSCVEFFFSPGSAPSDDYFNLEVNCGGTMLLHHGPSAIPERVPLPVADVHTIDVTASLPRCIEPERDGPLLWWVRYRMPFELLERHAPVQRPAPDVRWRANFYKCADGSSHPHWLTWAPVDLPEPQFHVPRCFGTLRFAP